MVVPSDYLVPSQQHSLKLIIVLDFEAKIDIMKLCLKKSTLNRSEEISSFTLKGMSQPLFEVVPSASKQLAVHQPRLDARSGAKVYNSFA